MDGPFIELLIFDKDGGRVVLLNVADWGEIEFSWLGIEGGNWLSEDKDSGEREISQFDTNGVGSFCDGTALRIFSLFEINKGQLFNDDTGKALKIWLALSLEYKIGSLTVDI